MATQYDIVLFTSGRNADTDLWCVELKNGRVVQLTRGDWRNEKGRFSPDRKRIVYVSNQEGPRDLWLMDGDGKNPKRLTTDKRWYDHPDWSPCGKRVVCTSNHDGANNNDIWLFEIATATWERLTDDTGSDSFPAWSPDGRQIAFASTRGGNEDIWVLDLATKSTRQLTTAPGRDFAPAWSPDGSKIAFVADRATDLVDRVSSKPDLDVWIMNADGSNPTRVTGTWTDDRCVAWAPDGKALIYCASRIDEGAERLMVVSPNGHGAHKVKVDRTPLERDIGAEPRGLFSILPRDWARPFYPKGHWGSELYPHWI